MSATALATRLQPQLLPLTEREILALGQDVLKTEAAAIARQAIRIDRSFYAAVECIHNVQGNVIVSGMGKAGLIGRKVAATLASTGTASHFVHPGEAIHGDLGSVGPRDVVLILSYSGETAEITRLLPTFAKTGSTVIAVTASQVSTLGRAASIVLELGHVHEACLLGLAPTSSTTAMLALGDALALVVSRLRGFQAEDFARLHPGGSLGRRLSRVEECMRVLSECRVAPATLSVRDVVVACSKPGRRSGAIMLTDAEGRLVGIFTDTDLARLFETRNESALDAPVANVMTATPHSAQRSTLYEEAVGLMSEHKISELPVVDERGRPIGMIDVTDVVGTAEQSADSSNIATADHESSPTIRLFSNC